MTPKTNVEMRPAIASRADPSVDFICPASLLACAAGRCSPAGLATECGKIAKKLEVKDTFHSRSVAYPHFECPQLAQVRQPSIIRMSYCPQDGQAGPAGRPRFTTSACGSDFKPIPSPSMKPMEIRCRSITPPMAARIEGTYLPPIQAPPRGSNTAFSSSTTKETSPPR